MERRGLIRRVSHRVFIYVSTHTRASLHHDPTNDMNAGLFKEIICDGAMSGKLLPRNLRVVAACNPYRLRNEAMRGHAEAQGIKKAGANILGLTDKISDPHRVSCPVPECLIVMPQAPGSISPPPP